MGKFSICYQIELSFFIFFLFFFTKLYPLLIDILHIEDEQNRTLLHIKILVNAETFNIQMMKIPFFDLFICN